MLRRKLLAALLLCVVCSPSRAQQILSAPTTAAPVKVTTGLTYQQLLAATGSNNRHSITIQNNNATDNCEIIIVGVGAPWIVGDTTSTARTINAVSMTALQASIVLLPAQAYTRYYPFIPPDQILGTCTTTGDSLYVDTQ